VFNLLISACVSYQHMKTLKREFKILQPFKLFVKETSS